jgi:hypothetical protein
MIEERRKKGQDKLKIVYKFCLFVKFLLSQLVFTEEKGQKDKIF